MFDNFEVTVIRVEGLGNISKALCCINMNESLIESISLKELENAQHTCTVPSKGELRISIEDQTLLATVRFDIDIIKCQGYHWLPLFLDASGLILEVPEEVGLPRILLIFQSRKFLSPVIEITETSELSENIEYADMTELPTEEISKNVELRMKIIELEQTLEFEKISQLQNVEKITRDFKFAMDKLTFEMEKYKIWSEKYKSKCNSLTEELEVKNKSMQVAVSEKEMVKAELSLYQTKYDELLKIQESMYKMLESKEQEIAQLKRGLEKSKQFKLDYQEIVSILPLHPKASKKPKLIDFTIEPKPFETTVFKKNPSSDNIHNYLQENLSKLRLEGLFQKSNEQYYKVGCKRVGVLLKNGNLYCKFGDSFKTLENYIYSYCNTEVEAFIKKRANSGPSHRRSQTFSSSFDNTMTQEKKTVKVEKETKLLRTKNKSITPALVRNSKSKIG